MIPIRATLAVLTVGLLACAPAEDAEPSGTTGAGVGPDATIEWGLVMHGGAGTLSPDEITAEQEAEYRTTMTAALEAGHAVLAGGGSPLDAVVEAIVVLEDSPLFNAGKGAVFTAAGTNELDASIMDGVTGNAGAVAGVTSVRNPIRLARLVMDSTEHVLLAGEGAEAFARVHDVELVDPAYFHTERRWRQLEEARAEEHGTVGVIALDRDGRIAAGTSTGGTTNKRWGRVGDSPIIGAGTFAGAGCGVSSTGTGEYFIRNVVAYDICARVRYEGVSLAEAAHTVIMEKLEAQRPGLGGIVALDADGHVVASFNTTGMYRGWIDADGRVETAIYR